MPTSSESVPRDIKLAPTISQVPCLQKDDLQSAQTYLEHYGLVARSPCPIRASDYYTALNDPFLYYLTARLGIRPVLSWSEALSRGSWMHAYLEHINSPEAQRTAALSSKLATRLNELSTLCSNNPTLSYEDVKQREEDDFNYANTICTALCDIPFFYEGAEYKLANFLSSRFTTLANEFPLQLIEEGHTKSPLVCVLDRLVYDKISNQIWIIDYKSCSESPKVRLASAPVEFQTQLYCYIVSKSMFQLITKFNLPLDTRFGGMMHIALQKPPIKFDKRTDRPFTWKQHTLKSGPRRGLIEMRKEYLTDIPDYKCFLARVKRWYLACDEYDDLRVDRMMNPVIDVSLTSSDLALNHSQLPLRLEFLHDLATRPAHPGAYLQNPHSIRTYNDLSTYAPFYLCPVTEWPSIMAKGHLMTFFRDEALMEKLNAGD